MQNPLFAVAFAAAIAIAGTVMAMHPGYRSFGWLFIAILAALFCYSAAALMISKAPELFGLEDARQAFTWTFVALGVMMSLSVWFAVDNPFGTQSQVNSALLRLQFFGDDRIPTEIRSENVTTWFAYFTPRIKAESKDAATGKVSPLFETSKVWVLFLTLDKPTNYREVTVGFSAPGLPIYDVMQSTPRSIVVQFRGEIPTGAIEISTKS